MRLRRAVALLALFALLGAGAPVKLRTIEYQPFHDAAELDKFKTMPLGTSILVGGKLLPASVFHQLLVKTSLARRPVMSHTMVSLRGLPQTVRLVGAPGKAGSPSANIPVGAIQPALEAAWVIQKLPFDPGLVKAGSPAPACRYSLCAEYADGHAIAHTVTLADYYYGGSRAAIACTVPGHRPSESDLCMETNPGGSFLKQGWYCVLWHGAVAIAPTKHGRVFASRVSTLSTFPYQANPFEEVVTCPGDIVQIPTQSCPTLDCAPRHASFTISDAWIFDHYETNGSCAGGFNIAVTTGKGNGVTHALSVDLTFPDPSKYYNWETIPLSCSVNVFIKGPPGVRWSAN